MSIIHYKMKRQFNSMLSLNIPSRFFVTPPNIHNASEIRSYSFEVHIPEKEIHHLFSVSKIISPTGDPNLFHVVMTFQPLFFIENCQKEEDEKYRVEPRTVEFVNIKDADGCYYNDEESEDSEDSDHSIDDDDDECEEPFSHSLCWRIEFLMQPSCSKENELYHDLMKYKAQRIWEPTQIQQFDPLELEQGFADDQRVTFVLEHIFRTNQMKKICKILVNH